MISMNKKYRNSHSTVTVLTTERAGNYPVLAMDDEGVLIECTAEGKVFYTSDSEMDLVEVTPYGHIKTDDNVFVWDGPFGHHPNAVPRHFSHASKNSLPHVFENGRTSFTLYDYPKKTVTWDNCLTEEEWYSL